MWKRLLKPRIVIPVLLSAALLAFVFSLSNISLVMDRITRLSLTTMAITFALAIGYLVVKWVQFHRYLMKEGISATWRQSVLSYAVGEMTLPIPAGIYAQNYVLRSTACADFSRSSAATTAILIVEAIVSLLIVGILDIPAWWWLRPVILGLLGLSAIVVALFLWVRPLRDLAGNLLQAGPLHKVGPEFIETIEGVRDLFHPRIAAVAMPIAIVYLLDLVAGFFVTAHGIGISSLNFQEAVTIYLFAVAVVELVPFSSNLGFIEAGGVGAAQAWGYSFNDGLAMMLAFRLVWTGSVWLLGGITILLLRGELGDRCEDPRDC